MLHSLYLSFITVLVIFFLFILKIFANLFTSLYTKLMMEVSSYLVTEAAETCGEKEPWFVDGPRKKNTFSQLWSLLRTRYAYFSKLTRFCLFFFFRANASIILVYVKDACFLEYERCVELVSYTRNLNSLEQSFYGFITCFTSLFVFYYMCIYALTRAPNTISALWALFCFFLISLVWFYKTGRDQRINLLIRVKGSELQGDYLYYKYLLIPIVLSLYFLVFYCIFIDFFFLDILQQQFVSNTTSDKPAVEIPVVGSRTYYNAFLGKVWEFYPKYDTSYFDGMILEK